MSKTKTKIVLVGAFDWLTRYVEKRLKELLPLVARVVDEPIEFQVVRLLVDSLEAQREGLPKLVVFRGNSVNEVEVALEDVIEETDVFVVNVVRDPGLATATAE